MRGRSWRGAAIVGFIAGFVIAPVAMVLALLVPVIDLLRPLLTPGALLLRPLVLAAAVAVSSKATTDFVGERLRAYWRAYPGVTRLSASASRDVGRGLALVLTADNLLDRQQGEREQVAGDDEQGQAQRRGP